MGLLFKVDTYLPIAVSGILILLYGATLIKVCGGSKYKFVIQLLILLILSNIGLLLYKWSFYEMEIFLNTTNNSLTNCWGS